MSIKQGTRTIASAAPSTTWGSIEGILTDQVDLSNALQSKVESYSPVLTGIPQAPKAAVGTNTNQIATTSFVKTAIDNIDVLPSQSGKSGKFLTTNGTEASWIDVYPSQSGQSGKFLTTNGTTTSWSSVDALPSQSGQSGKYLITNGSTASWSTVNAETIKDQRSSSSLKLWSGTRAQYNAITSKDANTLYNITDDIAAATYEAYNKTETNNLITSMISTMLSNLYPVGSLYLSINSTCPLQSLISGSSWTLVSQDRVLQGAGTRGTVGSTLEESLPNHSHTFDTADLETGAGYIGWEGLGNKRSYTTPGANNPIYKDGAHVQPAAYLINVFKRTA